MTVIRKWYKVVRKIYKFWISEKKLGPAKTLVHIPLTIWFSGWWLNQPLWKIWVKLGSSSPNRGENKNIWNHHLGVSKNRGTPKWMVYNGKPTLLKWMIWGCHYFRKHPPQAHRSEGSRKMWHSIHRASAPACLVGLFKGGVHGATLGLPVF